ncbi:nitronate monooxygenase [Nocardioides sp.]|uniref:NAD(P)H-dependent flavin oxidoreductase n=1 Tax=Nocardioides sp. TaxID=35761 RepID=UPI00262BDC5C|nr:nitronate monooxygenase [Nocardioides sp.]
MSLFDVDLPLVAAPMAGGVTTPELIAAAMGSGAFAFVPAGYLSAEALRAKLGDVHAEGYRPGVNLFVPGSAAMPREAFDGYRRELADEAAAVDVTLPVEPRWEDDAWAAKIELLVREPVPWISFTFGLPPAADADRLRRAGSRLAATVTSVGEAEAAAALGLDAVLVQGSAAGGHSAVFDPTATVADRPTEETVAAVRATVTLPVVAAGGVDGPAAVARLRAAGAEAVVVGTLLMRTPEAGTSTTHRRALADPRFTDTRVTRAFTGRPARGLVNGFLERHDAHAPVGYPEVHHLTRELRTAAAVAGDAERVHLWAGTGWRSAREVAAAEVLADLAQGW